MFLSTTFFIGGHNGIKLINGTKFKEKVGNRFNFNFQIYLSLIFAGTHLTTTRGVAILMNEILHFYGLFHIKCQTFILFRKTKHALQNTKELIVKLFCWLIQKYTSGLYYKHVTIVNDASSGVNK
jgi:hypothetical protein